MCGVPGVPKAGQLGGGRTHTSEGRGGRRVQIRERSADNGSRHAPERLVDLLCARGDDASLVELRALADHSGWYAAERLVELLVDRGDDGAIAELRALAGHGDGYATELLVAMGDPETAQAVRARAHSGDRHAPDLVVARRVDPGRPGA